MKRSLVAFLRNETMVLALTLVSLSSGFGFGHTRGVLRRYFRPCDQGHFFYSRKFQRLRSAADDTATISSPSSIPHPDDQAQERMWLVVGDGDLSYSASLALRLAENSDNHKSTTATTDASAAPIALIASVLEDEQTHQQVYRNSRLHAETIRSTTTTSVQCAVQFSVDATKLETYFSPHSFDRIIFNFPHWRGKSNNRYNRQLLDQFLQSARSVLRPGHGQVHIALLHGQSGMDATDLVAWRRSWMVPMHANHYGLVLERIEPFTVSYDLSSHRGTDRAFSAGQKPQQYIFGFPQVAGKEPDAEGTSRIPPEHQMACRHELRLRLDPDRLGEGGASCPPPFRPCPYTRNDLVYGSVIPSLVQNVVPLGVHVELPLRDVVHRKQSSIPILIFLVVYSGANQCMTRAMADEIRAQVEHVVATSTGLEVAKAGRMVSKPFPYFLLPSIVKEYNVNDLPLQVSATVTRSETS